VKLGTYATKAEAKRAADEARKTRNSVLVSSQPSGYVVYAGKKK
jgi:AP2 domain